MSVLEELKPICIAYLHTKSIETYRREYRKANQREPSQEEINKFVSCLVGLGLLNDAADKLAIQIIKKSHRRHNYLKIPLDIGFAIGICSMLGALVFILIKGQIPEDLKSGSNNIFMIVGSCIFILWVIIGSIAQFKKEE